MKKFFYLSLGTGLGLGYSPVMPGTIGSLPGFVFVYLLSKIHYSQQLIFIIISFFIGVFIANQALCYFHEEDPHPITIDELFSLPITFFLIPLTPLTLVTGFILNRILDIIKPHPAYKSQNLPKGWGIMADDFITGIYSNILLRLFIFLLGYFPALNKLL